MITPCKNCKDRFVTDHYSCHAICEQYKVWSKTHKKEQMEIIRKRSLDNDSYSIDDSIAIRNKHWRRNVK